MKKNVFFAPLFLYNLALITHDATKSVDPSIKLCNFKMDLIECVRCHAIENKIKNHAGIKPKNRGIVDDK